MFSNLSLIEVTQWKCENQVRCFLNKVRTAGQEIRYQLSRGCGQSASYDIAGMPEEIIKNELLCFVFNKLPIMMTPTIHLLCVNTYEDQAVICAKNILKEQCEKNNVLGTNRFPARNGQDKKVKNMDDIIKMAHLLGTKAPCFVAQDLSNLPPVRVDNIDICGLLSKMESMEAELKLTKQLCMKNSERISVQLRNEPKQGSSGESASKKKDSSNRIQNGAGRNSTHHADSEATAVSNEDAVKVADSANDVAMRKSAKTPSFADTVKSSASASNGGRLKGKAPPYKGTLETTKPLVAERAISMFTKYWGKETTLADVTGMIKDKHDMEATCEDVLTQAKTYKCFKVTVKTNDFDEVFSHSYWPKGIAYKKFWDRSTKTKPVGKAGNLNVGTKGVKRDLFFYGFGRK